MSNEPFEIKPEVLSSVYYSAYLTLLAGKKYFEKYPCLESVGITLEPNPSFVITCKDQSGFAFLVSVIEPLRKRYKFGMWSPGQAVTRNKMVFSFFTHNNKEYIKEFLNLLGCEDSKFIDKIVREFTRPVLCNREPVCFETLKESCNAQNILATLSKDTCNPVELQTLFDHYILLSNDLDDLILTNIKFASLAIKRNIFTPIISLVKCGLNILSSPDNCPPLLTALSENFDKKEAIELLQFSLRYYVTEYYLDCVIAIIDICKTYNISVDEPGQPSGKTALHWASIKGHKDIRELLIDAGADPTKKDASGKSSDMYFEENNVIKSELK